jgi:hypothetical protein
MRPWLASGQGECAARPYATVRDVQGRVCSNIWPVSDPSQPDRAEVEDWLCQISHWMDAQPTWLYEVPITDPGDREILRPVLRGVGGGVVWNVLITRNAGQEQRAQDLRAVGTGPVKLVIWERTPNLKTCRTFQLGGDRPPTNRSEVSVRSWPTLRCVETAGLERSQNSEARNGAIGAAALHAGRCGVRLCGARFPSRRMAVRPRPGADAGRATLRHRAAHRRLWGPVFGALAVTLREGGTLIGYCGLQLYLCERPGRSTPEVELFYKLGRPYWGRGYATEACREVLRYAFEELRLPRIVTCTHRENVRSVALLRRLGMRIEPDPTDAEGVLATLDYGGR